MSWNWITFSFYIRRIFTSTTIRCLHIYMETLFINFENFWHILRECSLHDRAYLLNGWMERLFERATFQQMLNMASPHTSGDTLLRCKDKCSTHIHISHKMKRKKVKETGECDEMRQKFYLIRYIHITCTLYTFILSHELYSQLST